MNNKKTNISKSHKNKKLFITWEYLTFLKFHTIIYYYLLVLLIILSIANSKDNPVCVGVKYRIDLIRQRITVQDN